MVQDYTRIPHNPKLYALNPKPCDTGAQDYTRFYLVAVAVIVGFGGLLSPVAEVKLGLGGAAAGTRPLRT